MKTKRTKKLVSVLLCMALQMSFLPLASITAYALDAEIDQVAVSIAPPVVGSTNTVPIVVSAEPEKYTAAASDVWKDPGGNVATAFTSDMEYRLIVVVTPQTGYALAADTTVTVNGDALEQSGYLGGQDVPACIFEYVCTPTVLGTVDAVELENVPTGEIGTAAAPYAYTGTEFSVTGVWEYYDYADNCYKPMAATDIFADGNLYRLALSVIPAEGYELSQNCYLRVNGALCENFNCGLSYGNCWMTVSYVEEIQEVNISKAALPEAKIGESFGGTVNVPVPAGSNYTASGYWYTVKDMVQVISGTFEKGREYYFRIIVTPKEGYAFSPNASAFIDGEYTWMGMNGVAQLHTEQRTSFATVLSQAEFLELPTAELGKKLQTGTWTVSVPAVANYTAEANWYVYDEEYDSWMPVDEADGTDTVQAGKVYELDVQAIPADGYEFAEDVILKAYGVDQKVPSSNYTGLLYSREFSFCKTIEKVQVDGVVQPQAGKDATVDDIKVPADANYTIDYVMWYDTTDYTPATKFQAGHSYELEIALVAKDGYRFARNTQVLLDGKAVTEGKNISEKDVYIYTQYSLKEILPQVSLKHVPQMQVGQTAKTDVEIPADAKYTALVEWLKWNADSEEYEPFAGTFAAGEVYALSIHVAPNDGYRFTQEGTKGLINGQESDDFHFFGDMAFYMKEFATEQKIISRIEMKVEKPVVGHHASIEPTVTVVSGTGVVLDEENGMLEWVTGDVQSYYSVYDFFTADAEYGIAAQLRAQNGYCFADDLVVVVNGVTLPKEAVGTGYKMLNITYFFNMQNAEQEKGDGSSEVNGSDNQGDSAANFLWAGIMALSLAAFATCVLGKKRGVIR